MATVPTILGITSTNLDAVIDPARSALRIAPVRLNLEYAIDPASPAFVTVEQVKFPDAAIVVA